LAVGGFGRYVSRVTLSEPLTQREPRCRVPVGVARVLARPPVALSVAFALLLVGFGALLLVRRPEPGA
jgi:hypothetical protein